MSLNIKKKRGRKKVTHEPASFCLIFNIKSGISHVCSPHFVCRRTRLFAAVINYEGKRAESILATQESIKQEKRKKSDTKDSIYDYYGNLKKTAKKPRNLNRMREKGTCWNMSILVGTCINLQIPVEEAC